MASSKDFESIWESYQDVVKTQSISIVDYCQRNGIVYSQFQRWYKKHVGGVSVVPVSDSDVLEAAEVMSQQKEIPPFSRPTKTRVNFVNIEFCNGLKVYQKQIDYVQLKQLVEKLEALC
jgi:hypothetical protein